MINYGFAVHLRKKDDNLEDGAINGLMFVTDIAALNQMIKKLV